MRSEHQKAIAFLTRLDTNPEIPTLVVLDALATFEAIFSADRRNERPFIEEFARSLTRPVEEES